MSKFACLVLCVVAVSLSSVYAGEDGNPPHDEFLDLVNECAEQHGVTMLELDGALRNNDVSVIKPCFWGCAFTKAGFLNDQGQYDLESGLSNLKRFMRGGEGLGHMEDIAKECESVKDKPVSDGKAGCEMGTLAAACFLEQMEHMRPKNAQ